MDARSESEKKPGRKDSQNRTEAKAPPGNEDSQVDGQLLSKAGLFLSVVFKTQAQPV